MEHGIGSTPQDIGLAECTNKTVVAMTKHMLKAQKLEKSPWAEAVTNTVYILNRCPMRALHSVTPKEMWSGRRPCVAHMCVFGSITCAMVPNDKRGKFDMKESNTYFLDITKVWRRVYVDVFGNKVNHTKIEMLFWRKKVRAVETIWRCV